MALFCLFKKKGRSATDTIDLTRMQSVKDRLAATPTTTTATTSTDFGAANMDLPMGTMGTFDQTPPASSTPSYSYTQTADEKLSVMQTKFTALYQRVDLLEHKVDRLERKTGIKSENEI
jgi:hypothetical protein